MKRRVSLLALIVALPVLSGCASVFDDTLAIAELPYHRTEDGRIVVGVSVNGTGPHIFAIDTAASRSVLYEPIRDEIGIPYLNRDVMVQGIVRSGLFPLVHVDRIGVGATDWTDVDLVALPGGGPLDGILVLDFLRDYTIVFSTRKQQVSLFEPGTVAADAYQGWWTIPLVARNVSTSGRSFFFLDLRLGDETVPAVFDLGMEFNVLNWPAARLIDLSPDYLRKRRAPQITGALGAPRSDVFHVNISRFRTGSMTWNSEPFVIGDLAVFETLVDASEPTAIVGSELFMRRDFVIDFARSRLLVNRRKP